MPTSIAKRIDRRRYSSIACDSVALNHALDIYLQQFEQIGPARSVMYHSAIDLLYEVVSARCGMLYIFLHSGGRLDLA